MKIDGPLSGTQEEPGETGRRPGGEDPLPFPIEDQDMDAREPGGGVKWRSGFPYKASGLALLLLAAAGFLYLRCPSRTEDPDAGDPAASGETTRLVLAVDSGSRPGPSEGGTDLIRLTEPEDDGSRESLLAAVKRLEGKVDALAAQVQRSNEQLDLLRKQGPESEPLAQAPRIGEPFGPGPSEDQEAPAAREPAASASGAGTPVPVAAAPAQPSPPAESPPDPSPAARRQAPQKAAPDAAAPAPSRSAGRETVRYHVVAPGENLYRIGLKYNLTVTGLMDLNGLTPGQSIRPGQRLRVSIPED